MEVHHHPKVEKKNFKEYLLEFMMIFLAVTLGFFAENIREKITEHSKAKIYAAAMVKDLKSDTAELKSYLDYTNFNKDNTDSIIQLLSANEPKDIRSGKLYWHSLTNSNHFIPNDATFQQMKNSGSLQYFTNELIAQKVAQYDRLCRRMQDISRNDEEIYLEVRKLIVQIFEIKYSVAAGNMVPRDVKSFDYARIDSFMQTNPPLLTYDKAVFNRYAGLLRSRFLNNQIETADTLYQLSTSLIGDLKKEYHLK